MTTTVTHPAIAAYLDALTAAGRGSTAEGYRTFLRMWTDWLCTRGVDLLAVAAADIRHYQIHLATTYQTWRGSLLAPTTQATAIIVVRSLYAHLAADGILSSDPAATIRAQPLRRPATVTHDHLTTQETIALLSSAADRMVTATSGSVPWALACRNLALIALAIATGRRCGGLMALHLTDLDLERCELRVSAEKSRTGRVLPVAAWAVAACNRYIRDARPILLGKRPSDALWVTQHRWAMTKRAYAYIVDDLVAATIRANPDLTDLPVKCISTHSMRVSFAAMLFANGCGIRALNELLLHSSLDTTARYTPISRDELRAALLAVHPRTAVA